MDRNRWLNMLLRKWLTMGWNSQITVKYKYLRFKYNILNVIQRKNQIGYNSKHSIEITCLLMEFIWAHLFNIK